MLCYNLLTGTKGWRAKKMPRLGMFAWFSYELPIEKRLQLIQEAGFDAVSLWWGEELRLAHPALARQMGLAIDNIHTPFERPNNLWLDGAAGDAYLATLMQCVWDCAALSIPTMVIHPGSMRNFVPVSQIGLDRIAKLVHEAEKNGVNLAFENLGFLDHLEAVLAAFSSKRVGFCFDSGHEHFNHPDAHCLAKYGSRLFAVHLDDNFGDNDTHLLPFDGSVNWPEIAHDLATARPLSYLTLEVDFNRQHEKAAAYTTLSAAKYLARAYERAVRVRAMMEEAK
ncbi:MAG: sugar phosphate isomerase/epimerase [Oscillospiraceae bacterium]|nr:sugar phosphate isomerase/epimerase [Oscillospiraceae bacterium]